MINNRIWYLGTGLISGAVLLLGWFIGVAPLLTAAAVAESEVELVNAQNLVKEAEIDRLRVQFQNVGDTRNQLAAVRESLPNDAAMTDFLAELERLQGESAVTVTGFSVTDAQPYAPAVTEATTEEPPADAEAPEGAVPTENADSVAMTDTAADGAVLYDPRVTSENFVLIPVNLDIAGGVENVSAFLGALQGTKRLFLVTDVTMEAVDEAASALGGHKASISGFLYVLLDSTVSAPSVIDAAPAVAEAAGTQDQ